MKKLIPLLLCGGALALTGCETTGDPTQGGWLGWSERKAQESIYEREATLSAIESDTARQRRQGSYLEGQLDAKRDEGAHYNY
ncbi:MAG: hypothetical protein ACFCU3_08860 [Verrucomicrobiales bacterium]